MTVLYWTLRSLLSHWRKHPIQFFSLFTGLWLATALLTGVLALNGQARESYARASQLIGGIPQATLSARNGSPLPQESFSTLRRLGWPVSPVLQGSVVLERQNRRLQVMGIEPVSLPAGSLLAGEPADAPDLTAFISPPNQTWIAEETLRELDLHNGDQPLLANGQQLPPLQGKNRMAPGLLLVDIGVAQRLLDMPHQISRLILPASVQGDLPPPWNERLQWQHQSNENDPGRLTESFHLNLTALGLLAFAVGLFIVHAAIGLALEQRRPLLRTVRASGVSVKHLLLALVIELSTLALLGGIAGVVSGYVLASLLLPDVAASLRGLYGAEVAGQLTLSPTWWLGSLALSLIGALLAGANSLWRAARLPLLALANHEAWHQAHRAWLHRQGWVAGIAALVALTAAWVGDSLTSGFILMGSLLLASALGLPLLLSTLLRLISRPGHSPLTAWFLADCRQQLPGMSLALMALLLALAANIGAGSMTEGFRQTFTTWLDQRLSAELYIRPQTPEQAVALQQWLPNQPAVRRVLPGLELETEIQGWPLTLAGMEDDATYRQHWPLLEAQAGNPWDALFAGGSLMLSEQLARHLKVGIGHTIELPTAEGIWQARVVAIYADYGNPRGHILVNAADMRKYWPALPVSRYAVRMDPTAVATLKHTLQRNFSLDDTRLVDQARLKEWATQVFERTFSATTALNTLTLIVAGIALFIALLTQSQSRLGQLAPLWAMGVTRRQLMLLNLGQTWLLTLLTLVFAIPLGILLAWCLVAVINVQAFGWRLPLQVFPSQLIRLAGLALLATWLASAWPLWSLWRSRPVDLLRVLSDER
ncbi:putative ABC transport system permease protein [Pseudomonas duriflava]|uniref:Putative ABC transport system permease protein n=1 Tax=Pseudomonas duriflava TaxID=459528 RepID=A0A562QAD7_9PSED|nr:FtsX-like permease family protein [Pseudomonas duriflava]TWI53679.1 putative ABC transport system permease protein [Pseudomonas duriflava]